MKRVKLIVTGIFWLLAVCSSQLVVADELIAANFIQFVSTKSKAEVAAATLALQTSGSVGVKAYAQRIMDQQAVIQAQLESLAQQEGIVLDRQPPRTAFIFIRKGETFDTAYANKRAAELKRMVKVTRKAMFSETPQVRRYAEYILPVLMQHWYQTQQLVLALNNSASPSDSRVATR